MSSEKVAPPVREAVTTGISTVIGAVIPVYTALFSRNRHGRDVGRLLDQHDVALRHGCRAEHLHRPRRHPLGLRHVHRGAGSRGVGLSRRASHFGEDIDWRESSLKSPAFTSNLDATKKDHHLRCPGPRSLLGNVMPATLNQATLNVLRTWNLPSLLSWTLFIEIKSQFASWLLKCWGSTL